MRHELRIDGMHCEGCAGSLQRYLRSEPGVEDATVSYEDGRGTVRTDPGTDVEDLLAAIERMGYDAAVVESG